ncbi:MAG TPA: hypothetical protein PKD83_04065 [Ignavibacteria bacterium]|nr:hypothetical protein [Ignavibacteria bacterium]
MKQKKSSYKNFKYKNLLDLRILYPENKFVIYTRGRTGSTLLTDLINCHSEIFCDVEIFNFMYSNGKVLFPELYIDSCSKRAVLKKKSTYGFKVKISQLKNEHKYKNYEKILEDLCRKGWKFIYLKRENYITHMISNKMAAETNVYHLKNEDEPYKKKIHIEGKLLLDAIKFGEETAKEEEENLKNIPHLKILYEKDLWDNSKHQETADRIFSYLGLSSQKVKANYKKVVPVDLRETIINFDEVYNFFKDTEYINLLK